ncbi:MAG: leucine-rich repeat protein, partial [Candidatus Riflebacteria bacterium]|nr:leucine-rich repeat protein [Candidatus Riflebacteria bacterium]
GKAFYENSSDSSSIQVYLDKNEGVFTRAVLNKVIPDNRIYDNEIASRSIVSFSTCAADGSYHFNNLESGTYTVYAHSPNSAEKAVFRNITVLPEKETLVADITLTATGSISGKVSLDNSLDNNIGFIVSIAGTSFMASTDSDGRFRITDIPADTGYQIIVMKGNYARLLGSDITVAPFIETSVGNLSIQSEDLQGNETVSGVKDVIHYELNGGILPEGAPLIYTYGTNVVLEAPSKTGFNFVGFYLNENYSGNTITMLTSDYVIGQKLYARWMRKAGYDILKMTESGTVSISGELSEADLEDMAIALKEQKALHPEIELNLDFSETSSVADSSISFSDYNNIKGISISGPLMEKFPSLFGHCESITHITICEGVEVIEDQCFSGYSNLKIVSIPSTLQHIGQAAFSDCNKLGLILNGSNLSIDFSSLALNERVYVCKTSAPTSSEQIYIVDDNFVFDKEKNSLLCYFGSDDELVLPDIIEIGDIAVTEYSIYDKAFINNTLKKIIISDSVTSIGAEAFSGCHNLNTIEIPDSVTSIGDSAFRNCDSLKSIKLPDSITSIGNATFDDCNSLNAIEIPDSVTTIGNSTFRNCNNLKSIKLPDSITSIGNEAFDSCYRLSAIELPDSISRIGAGTFRDCPNLRCIKIPAEVTEIEADAFYGCDIQHILNYSDLNIRKGSDEYGGIASNAINVFNSSDTSLFILDDSFVFDLDTNSLVGYFGKEEKIELPSSIETSKETITHYNIGGYIFYYYENLISIEIPDSVTSIGESAFYRCENLKNITLPDFITSIGDSAFCGCFSLNAIKIPASVTSIGNYAFYSCFSLNTIEIPDSVTSIGRGAFVDCEKLKGVSVSGIWEIYNYDNELVATVNTDENSDADLALLFKGKYNNCSWLRVQQ